MRKYCRVLKRLDSKWTKVLTRAVCGSNTSNAVADIISTWAAPKQGQEIEEVLPTGLKFADGEILEADEIVFATGYLNMRTQCRKIFGDEIADRVKDVWGFDEEGELRTMWRKSGHPGFWFMGGNLALCRWYSKLLALQIKGLEEGIYKYDDL
jgi:hypothetical protein